MAFEIERKWICGGFPDFLPLLKEMEVEVFYLCANRAIEARIQKKWYPANPSVPSFKLSVKTGVGLSRTEHDMKITAEEFDEMLRNTNLADHQPVHKCYRKYVLPSGEYLEVSLVDNKWFYAEIEFPSKEAAKDFVLPYNWSEVTNKPEYAMRNYWLKKLVR